MRDDLRHAAEAIAHNLKFQDYATALQSFHEETKGLSAFERGQIARKVDLIMTPLFSEIQPLVVGGLE